MNILQEIQSISQHSPVHGGSIVHYDSLQRILERYAEEVDVALMLTELAMKQDHFQYQTNGSLWEYSNGILIQVDNAGKFLYSEKHTLVSAVKFIHNWQKSL